MNWSVKTIKEKLFFFFADNVLWIIYHMKRNRWEILKSGLLAFIGFILSPLSWWNDILINIPLAYGFAYVTGKIFSIFMVVNRPAFMILFVAGYFMTNILGFLMIHYSVKRLSDKGEFNIKSQIFVSLAYTAVILVLGYLDVFNLVPDSVTIIPQWVQP